MPAMGDSVSEGTVLEWHKAEGDAVSADETLVEISTDKVDAEVPAPIDGTVVKVHAAEGDTIHVGAVLAEIAPTNGAAPAAVSAPAADAPAEPEAAEQVVDIVMPAMGESVSEGVVLEWAKQVGEPIDADDTIVEISTDKVDAEVPAPASGTVTEILAQAGETVTVGQVIGRMTAVRRRRAPRTRPRPSRRARPARRAWSRSTRPTGRGSPRSPSASPPPTASTSPASTAAARPAGSARTTSWPP